MERLGAAFLVVMGLSAPTATAETPKGNIWEVELVVDGVAIVITPETRAHPGIAASVELAGHIQAGAGASGGLEVESRPMLWSGASREDVEPFQWYDDLLVQQYIGRVGQSLVPDQIDRELRFTFRIVDDAELDAFALPDGTVAIHSGLVAILENEAQLATVLGHEIAHVVHGHGSRRARPTGAASPSERATLLTSMEAEADRVGLGYVVAAGYEPSEALRVWEICSEYVSDRDTSSSWYFGDRASHRARIETLTEELRRLRGPRDPEGLRNEAEYAEAVSRLRRRNAVADYERGELQHAKRAFQAILERDAGDAVAHLYLGKIVWDTEGASGADEALAALRLASELAPSLAEPHREMGRVYLGIGYRESAASAFRRYLEMAPDASDVAKVEAHLRELS